MRQRVANVHERPSDAPAPALGAPGAPRRRRSRSGILLVVMAVVVALALGFVALRLTARSTPVALGPSISAPADPGARLSWSPPVLDNPTVVTVDEQNDQLVLQPEKDYRIVLPARPITLRGGLRISGGHNVVLQGGEIVVPSESQAPNPEDRRGLYLKGQFGTMFVEGLKISGADLSEGIDLDQREGATVVLQNVAVSSVHGTRDTNHADVLQTWAGPAQLKIDGLTGTTQYQGFFLLPRQFTPEAPVSWDLRRVVLTSDPAAPGGKTGYLLWTEDDHPWLAVRDVVLVDPRSDLQGVVRPRSAWADGVSLQPTASGAALPAGAAGVGYVSPGYLDQETP